LKEGRTGDEQHREARTVHLDLLRELPYLTNGDASERSERATRTE
jgi:hypothetical protein